jgi:hypothetical protein
LEMFAEKSNTPAAFLPPVQDKIIGTRDQFVELIILLKVLSCGEMFECSGDGSENKYEKTKIISLIVGNGGKSLYAYNKKSKTNKNSSISVYAHNGVGGFEVSPRVVIDCEKLKVMLASINDVVKGERSSYVTIDRESNEELFLSLSAFGCNSLNTFCSGYIEAIMQSKSGQKLESKKVFKVNKTREKKGVIQIFLRCENFSSQLKMNKKITCDYLEKHCSSDKNYPLVSKLLSNGSMTEEELRGISKEVGDAQFGVIESVSENIIELSGAKKPCAMHQTQYNKRVMDLMQKRILKISSSEMTKDGVLFNVEYKDTTAKLNIEKQQEQKYLF